MYNASDHCFVVCAYKESPFLDECLASLSLQECTTNVLITTSTPCDYIFSAAQRYGVEVRVKDGEPSIGGDWNYALAQAQAPLVTIAHQDDVYLPDYSKNLLEAANRVEQLIVYFTDYGELRPEGLTLKTKNLSIKRAMLAPLMVGYFRQSRFIRRSILSFGSAICCPSVTFNLETIPGEVFNEKMHCSLDWDAWERLSHLYGSFYYEKQIQTLHRIHEGSETTRLIADETRSLEDMQILKRCWPDGVARLIGKAYKASLRSNTNL